MSVDIADILNNWPYEPGQMSARRVTGLDGSEKIQMRLDLGLLQMEVAGSPDGIRPHGCESLLEYHEQQLADHIRSGGLAEEFHLDSTQCEQLRNEGLMYYHRYLAEFILEDYRAAVRDTTRNLRMMDFCRTHASEQTDREIMDQHRAYVIMMRTRASALLTLGEDRLTEAMAEVSKGIGLIEETRENSHMGIESGASELAVLRALKTEIQGRLPKDPAVDIQRQLTAAIDEERYEDAVDLRDQLRRMKQHTPADGP